MSRVASRALGWSLALALIACLGGGVLADRAVAHERTYTLRYGPVRLGGFETRTPKPMVDTPRRRGFIVGMNAHLVYASGRRVSIRRVMLHHVVFINRSAGRRTTCPGRSGEPFWGTGEERQRLVLPAGYGYPVRAGDSWRMQAMLMSHSLARQRVYVEYRVRMVTGRRLHAVRPLWLRANGCSRHPSYDVDGGGAPGSTHHRSHDWRMPLSGRIVAAGAHLHGGSRGLTISQPRCGDRTLVRHDPRYGNPTDLVYRLRPVLHEPGPIATGYLMSRRGVPVLRGETLRVTGVYDNARPHPQVMAISHVYVAPDSGVERRCAPLPADRWTLWTRRDGVSEPPAVTVPLNGLDRRGRPTEIDRPPGDEWIAGARATVLLRNGRFQPANLSIALGGTVSWRWIDPFPHNVLLANGPRNVASPTRSRGGRHLERFTYPGTYRLFCYLHPLTMHQVIRVREG